jgi:WD40 repeat protein
LRETPYKGLVPYREKDWAFFFGRDSQRKIIVANLVSARLTLLYGPSGVGKSSLLRAGVAHHLRQTIEQNIAQQGVPEFGFVVFNSWRDDPIEPLKQQVQQNILPLASEENVPAPGKGPRKQLPAELPEQETLVDFLSNCSRRINGELYIVLDQFEEYFLYHPHESGEDSFAGQFVKAINHPDLRVNFLISIREDSLAKLDRFKGRIPKLFDNYLRIDHLNRTAATEAITGPVGEYNLQWPNEPPVTIEQELITNVLDQVRTGQLSLGETGGGFVETEASRNLIETPYLQLVMTRLWDEEMGEGSRVLRFATLKRLGMAETIVKTHLDKTMDSLTSKEREIAARAFHYLVTRSGTKIGYTSSDLAIYAELPQAELAPVLRKLSTGNVRILREVAMATDPSAPPHFEIFHDVLAKAIVDWRSRFNQNREFMKSATADDQRKLTIYRLQLGAVVAILLLTIGLGIYGFYQAREAKNNGRKVESLELAAKAEDDLGSAAAVFWATKAVQAFRTAQAELMLRQSLANYPGLIATRVQENWIECAALAPDGTYIAAGLNDGTVQILNGQTGDLIRELKAHSRIINSIAISHDGERILTASDDHFARILDVRSGNTIATFSGHVEAVRSAQFSGDDKWVATASDDWTARVWEAASGAPNSIPLNHKGPVRLASFSHDGSMVLTASESEASVWNWNKPEPTVKILPHATSVYSAAFSPDGTLVATGSIDRARLWDLASGQESVLMTEFPSFIKHVAFSGDGKRLVTSEAITATVWDVATRKPIATTAKIDGVNVTAATLSPDGTRILTASDDKSARLWDAKIGSNQLVLKGGHPGPIDSATFSNDGEKILTVGRTVRLWKSRTPVERKASFDDYLGSEIGYADISPTGRFIFISEPTARKQRIWDRTSKAPVTIPVETGRSALVGAVSPDGRLIASMDQWPILNFSQPPTERLTVTAVDSGKTTALLEPLGSVNSIAFSPDSKYIVASNKEKGARLWTCDSAAWNCQAPKMYELAHDAEVYTAKFSPDGKFLVTASWDNRVRVWEVATRHERYEFSVEPQALSLSFSPDSQLLATAGRSVRILDLASGKVTSQLTLPLLIKHSAYDFAGNLVITSSDSGLSVCHWLGGECEDATELATDMKSGGFALKPMLSDDGMSLMLIGVSEVRVYPWVYFAPIPVLLNVADKRRGEFYVATPAN